MLRKIRNIGVAGSGGEVSVTAELGLSSGYCVVWVSWKWVRVICGGATDTIYVGYTVSGGDGSI